MDLVIEGTTIIFPFSMYEIRIFKIMHLQFGQIFTSGY
jgi:hypothetical protein